MSQTSLNWVESVIPVKIKLGQIRLFELGQVESKPILVDCIKLCSILPIGGRLLLHQNDSKQVKLL